MKNLLKVICLLFVANNIHAQIENNNIDLGLHAGYSITSSLVKGIANSDVFGNNSISASSIPALQLTADYNISERFSLGVALSHQRVSINAFNYSFTDINGESRTETFTTAFRRTQFAVRPLIHYGRSEKLDLYSGFRIGILNRGLSDFKGENVEGLDGSIFQNATTVLSGNRFSLGLTAFGLKYFFTENIGAGFEVNIGAPYILNFGITTRL